MISVHSMKRPMIGGQPYAFEFKGLSTDTKPSTWGGNDVGVNSLFFEQDTGDFYYLKQQGSESTQRTDYVNLTASDWFSISNYYAPNMPAPPEIDPLPETVTVIWDGETYSLTVDEYGNYGAPYNEQDDTYDFADYSFGFFRDDDFGYFNLVSKDNSTHTIVVYTEETVVTQAEWAKIGGGGDSPTPSGELIYEKDITQWTEDTDYGYYYTENESTDFQILPETITVIWDGDEYSNVVVNPDNGTEWGAFWDNDLDQYDWSTYPFSIYTNPPYNIGFSSLTGGEHTVKIYG